MLITAITLILYWVIYTCHSYLVLLVCVCVCVCECVCIHVCVCVCAQSCLTLCNPMDCSPPGSSVHGIFQARILEWVAISSSRGSSQPRNGPMFLVFPALAGRLFTTCISREALPATPRPPTKIDDIIPIILMEKWIVQLPRALKQS